MLNDDELDKLFENSDELSEDISEEDAEINNSDVDSEPAAVIIESKEESSDKEKKKADARRERIKEIENFENLVEQKYNEKLQKRQERIENRKKNYVPLKDRKYLEDFPISFPGLIAALVGILILVVCLSFALNPIFRLDSVVIEGNCAVSDEDLIEVIGMKPGDHLIRSYFGIERRVMAVRPYISSISIRAELPSTLHIVVEERQKICYIMTPDGYAAIDHEGTVLEFSADMNEDVHPVLCGLNINNVVLGQSIGVTDDLSYQKMIIVLGAVLSAEQNSLYSSEYSFFDSLQEIRILPSGMIFMTIELPSGSLLTVKLDEITTINDKMHWLLYAIEEGGMDGLPAGSLDMTEDSPVYHEYASYT